MQYFHILKVDTYCHQICGHQLWVVKNEFLNAVSSDSKIHGTNVAPTWGRQGPGGPHVGHTNLAIWVGFHLNRGMLDNEKATWDH